MPGQQRLGPREQVNQNTAFIDASQIYGNDRCDAADLREGIDGRLNTSLPVTGRGKHLLPKTTKNKECKAASGYCFYGGDARVSEQPGLAAMHTIFLREHNRLTAQLKVKEKNKENPSDFIESWVFCFNFQRVNPHWNDEALYQEGRHIIAAITQHITYNEFLPRVNTYYKKKLHEIGISFTFLFSSFFRLLDGIT